MRDPGLKNNPTEIEVVAVALIDREGRVLLQQRRAGGRHAGLWEFPGGKVEAGETRESALVREIAEELGIAIDEDALTLAGRSQAHEPGDAPLVLFLYRCARWRGKPVNLDAAAIGWFAPGEVAALAVPPLDVPLLAQLDAIVAAALGDCQAAERHLCAPLTRARSSAG